MREISQSIAVSVSAEISRVSLFGSSVGRANLNAARCPLLPLSKKLSSTTMREVISIHLGQCGVQCGNACWELYCLVRARALEPIARDPRSSPRWPAPPARALPPPTHILARRNRPPRARASRRPLAIPLYTSISQPPQPTRLRVPASFPSCLLVSHLARSRAAPSTGARHPARRPDALGQDDWRRR
jgi:hypothetical protein